MKKIAILFVAFLILLSFMPSPRPVNGYSETAEKEIYSMLKQKGFEKIYVSTDSDTLIIKLGFDAIPENAFLILLNAAMESFKKYSKANGVLVEMYLNDAPQFGLFINGTDASDYFKGILTDEEIENLVIPIDLKNDFQELSDDLLYYKVVAEEIFEENGVLNIITDYIGDKKDFNENFIGALFSAVQNCPYTKSINIKFKDENSFRVASVKSSDVLDLMNGEISPKEFENKIKIFRESLNGKYSFSTLFANGKAVNGIASLFFLLIAAVSFFASHKKKSQIAKILKAKRININKIPDTRKRIYGKFTGAVNCKNPLTAPFSKKQVVIYEGKAEEKNRKHDFKTVWEQHFSTDFFIADSHGGKTGVLIKKDVLPDIKLPILTRRKLSKEEIDALIKETGNENLSQGVLRITEKGIENGRKVFFIGGIARDDNGNFTFVRRPGYPNFIAFHSEKRLTHHTVTASRLLKFAGVLSLLPAVYFAILYFK